MPIGNSGRVVVIVDPELRQELHIALAEDRLNIGKGSRILRTQPASNELS
jgi:hypothetical protein